MVQHFHVRSTISIKKKQQLTFKQNYAEKINMPWWEAQLG